MAITINNLNNKGLQHFVCARLEWEFDITHRQNNSDTSILCIDLHCGKKLPYKNGNHQRYYTLTFNGKSKFVCVNYDIL